jgi:hypothetical protein
MKSIVTMLAMFVSLNAMAATSVLLQTKIVVGFAPIDDRGVYSTSLLSNGVVQYENNKGVVVRVLKLSKGAVNAIVAKIASLEVGDLQGEDTPQCMDAPSHSNVVMKDGQEIVIKTVFGCREKVMNTPGSYELNRTIQALDTMADLIKY